MKTLNAKGMSKTCQTKFLPIKVLRWLASFRQERGEKLSRKKKDGQSNSNRSPLIKQGRVHLDSGQAEANKGSVQQVELPHPDPVVAGLRRCPGPANEEILLRVECVWEMVSSAVHSSA